MFFMSVSKDNYKMTRNINLKYGILSKVSNDSRYRYPKLIENSKATSGN